MNKFKVILFFFVLFFNQSLLISQNIIFYYLEGHKIEIDSTLTNIFICVSTNSCHNCYIELNAFLRNEKIYDNSNYNIHTLSILDENNSYDIATKKAIYNSSKYYFPNINKRLFVISENNKNNYISSLNKKQFPIIIIETNNGIREIYTYKNFINAIKTNRFKL